jgi:hypothetical protein
MEKPAALLTLLEELKGEIRTSSVQTVDGSKVHIYLDGNAAAAEDPVILNRRDCEVLFDSAESIELVMKVLGRPKHASIELHEVELPQEVLDALEREFVSVVEN